MQFIVTTKKCTGCGTCAEICPTEAIRIESGKARITMECIDCGSCPRVCPEGAISQVSTKYQMTTPHQDTVSASPAVKIFQED